MKISSETVHQALDGTLSGVTLSQRRRDRILQQLDEPKLRRFYRPAARFAFSAAAIFSLALALSLGALAGVPGLAEKLNMLSRNTLSFFTPIERETTVNDIRMEVIAAMNDGDTAIVYVELQDLSGQNRLDSSVYIPDVHMSGMFDTQCENVYEKPDGSVILRLSGTGADTAIANSKVTLEMRSILAQNTHTDAIDTGLTIADIQRKQPDPELGSDIVPDSYEVEGAVDGPLYRLLESGTYRQLLEKQAVTMDGTPWLTILNYGMVGDVLHILTDPDNDLWYNTARFYLADAAGNPFDAETAVVDLDESNLSEHSYDSGNFADKQEQLLALPEDVGPQEMHLYYTKEEYADYIEGSWDVTFPLQEAGTAVSADCRLDMQPWTATSVEISQISVTVTGYGTMTEDSLFPEIVVTMRDGTVYNEYSGVSSMVTLGTDGKEDQISLKSFFAEPIDTSAVAEITINGQRIGQMT